MNLTWEVAVQFPTEKYYFCYSGHLKKKIIIQVIDISKKKRKINKCRFKKKKKSGLCGNKMSSLFLWLYSPSVKYLYFEGPDGHTVS